MDIGKDSTGFMWFAGHTGLSRWDGHQMMNYLPSENDEHAIGEEQVRVIHTAKNGVTYFGTQSGISIYDEHLVGFINFQSFTS